MKLPTYNLLISDDENDDTEVNFVALVDRPAIERNFLAFKDKVMLAVEDEDQRIVSGPAMIPDMPIYRKDKENGEFYVVFQADTIAKIAQRFFKKGYQGNINIDHSANDQVADSVFFESWIVDKDKGKMPLKGFEDCPDGTWFLSAKINNNETWEKIKSGEVRGFSVEGFFEYCLAKKKDEQSADEALLSSIVQVLTEAGIEL